LLLVPVLLLATTVLHAQQGLKGEYFNGTNFERKVLTRVDRALQFRWFGQSPAPGVDQTYYSIRWTGKLLAPATGVYVFSAEVDDGIRVWVGGRKVIDSWQLNDNAQFKGRVILKAGQYYDLRVDFFNAMLEGEIILFWQLPNPTDPQKIAVRQAVGAQFLRQKAPPTVVTKPVVTVKPKPVAKPTAKPVSPAKPVPRPSVARSVRPKPATQPPPARRINARPDSVRTAAVPASPPKSLPQPAPEAFVPHAITFEQSSYALTDAARAELDRLAEALGRNPAWRIDVTGHTDGLGDRRQNQTLSEYRAKVVATYLVRRGIAPDRIDFRGRGSAVPASEAAADSTGALNRRVTIAIR
jgi:outer membrane protein OmpA-like peptidoglycan-associated protein